MSKTIADYQIDLDQVRREDMTDKELSNLEAITNSLNKIQLILDDIDKRINALETP